MIPYTPKTSTLIPFTSGQKTTPTQTQPNILLGKLQAGTGYGSKVGAEQVAGAEKIASSIKQGAESMQKPGIGNKLLGAAQAGFGTISGATETAFAPITPLVKKITSAITPALRQQNPELASAYDKATKTIQDLSAKHPESATLIGDVANTLLLAIGGGEAKVLTEAPIKETLTKEALGGAKEDITDIITKGREKIVQKLKPKSESEILQKKLAPKPTVKEARLAESQGRLLKGKKPTLFKEGKPDTIVPTKKQIQARITIEKNIPNASKMEEPELYTAIGNKVKEISQKLKPEMKKVSILNDTVQKITDDWKKTSDRLVKNADASEEVNVIKENKQFEERLKKTKSNNMNDLWDERKSYDDSVPDNVKNANSQSVETLLNKKTRWLERRKILNDAINDSKNGLGKKSQQAFEEMSDMYNAQHDLLTKAKIETKLLPSKFKQFTESPKGRAIKGVLKGAAVIEGGKRLLTGKF